MFKISFFEKYSRRTPMTRFKDQCTFPIFHSNTALREQGSVGILTLV